MKPLSTLFLVTAIGMTGILTAGTANAQKQYKLRQTTSMMGMKSETTIYVKGMRKRTEGGGYAGQPNNLVTIEQCDKQRTITLNDKKKLYYIEPFSKEQEEVIDEDAKPVAVKTKPVPAPAANKTGGVITMYYNITDTGERKKMFDFTARHIWTTQKIKPSPEACTMKDSMIIKTDGWYIDLPEFNCPIRYKPGTTASNPQYQKPDCQDRYVTRRSGKGKLGFALIEKRTIIMGSGPAQTSEFVTDLETLELTTGKLDSMLFEIPPGYTEAKSADELQDKFDVNAYIKQAQQNNNYNTQPVTVGEEKKAGVTRIGVFAPTGEASVQPAPLQQQLVSTLTKGNVEAIAVATEEEARQFNCDLVLNTAFTRFKQGSKVGGLLKAIKNTDPGAAASFTIDAVLLLTKLADGSTRLEQKLSGKYDGKPDEAARKSMEEGGQLVLKGLK